MRTHPIIPAVLAGISLAGCVAGPDYTGPPPGAPLATTRGAFAQASADTTPETPIADWWRALGDPELDRLVLAALAANTDIEAAAARVAQSRALLRQRRADGRPETTLDAAYSRTRPAIAAFGIDVPGIEPTDIDLVDLSLDASWEIDFAGRRRRAVEGAVAEFGAAQATLDDVRVTVAAETAQAYIQLRAAGRRLALADEAVRLQTEVLDLVRQRNRLGVASELEIERAATLLASTRADREPLLAELATGTARLAVLTAREPGDPAAVASEGTVPMPPETVAIGDPGTLLQRRPDVRAAERRLAAATAGIGVATADLYPRVSLLGSIGFQSDGIDGLGSDAFTYGVGPRLTWAFPDFDRVRARIAERGSRRDEQLALYRGGVLRALEDAEGSLARYGRLRAEVGRRAEARRAAARAAELARLRYRAGAGNLIEVLDAERDRVAAEQAAAGADARLTQAYVALHKALGLAWRPPASDVPESS